MSWWRSPIYRQLAVFKRHPLPGPLGLLAWRGKQIDHQVFGRGALVLFCGLSVCVKELEARFTTDLVD